MIPLEPNTQIKYPELVRELHDALRDQLFPNLPACEGRAALLARLATAAGIGLSWWDVGGRNHAVTADTQRGSLPTMLP